MASEKRAAEEWICLTVGPEYDDHELYRRAELPNDAFPAGLDVSGEDIEGGEVGVVYEVWAVER